MIRPGALGKTPTYYRILDNVGSLGEKPKTKEKRGGTSRETRENGDKRPAVSNTASSQHAYVAKTCASLLQSVLL